jgi:hypothetical protein
MKIGGTVAAMLLALITIACNRTPDPASGNTFATGNTSGLAATAANAVNAAGARPAAKQAEAPAADDEEEEVAQDDHEDRSGPTRNAACEINDERAVACSFTPVLNDGSFDIDTPDRQLRVLVSGREAAVYERIGNRRIPLPGTLFRDPGDEACWVVEEGDADAPVTRVCAR